MTSYLTVPQEISYKELYNKGALSPSLYERVVCKNPNVKPVKELIEKPIKGKEVGSESYVDSSEYYFIRNRALQSIGYLLQLDSTSVIPIKPKAFINYDLSKGDILYSKDSNIGECCIIESDAYKKHMISSGILKLIAKDHPLYLFAFLKHSFVKSQLIAMTSRGATIKHSKDKMLLCVIPFPRGKNSDKVIAYVEKLAGELVEIEAAIREKDKAIHEIISNELMRGQRKGSTFSYQLPTIKEIETIGRLDAGIYSRHYKEKIFMITNYENGYEYLKDDKDGGKLGFSLKPGPSLEYKILKTRVDSDKPVKGFYTLLLPTNISDYGVLDKLQYMGTARKIEELKFGDILVGESGTWRSLVLLSNYDKCITNAHGVRIRHNKGDLVLSIFVRSMLAWYYKEHVFDYMVVGGSGGHLSPSYYDRIMIPNFPREIQEKIARLYYDSEKKELGIAQLNEKRLKLLDELDLVLDNIVNDKEVVITLN